MASSFLLKLFLVVGFSPNECYPLAQVTCAYRIWIWGAMNDSEFREPRSIKKKMQLLVEYGADINFQTIVYHQLKLVIELGWLDELDFLIKKMGRC